MKTVLTALFCTILLFLTFILGVKVGMKQVRISVPAAQSSTVIIDSSDGDTISVTQDGVNDTSYIKVNGKVIHQQMNGSGDNVAGDKVIKN